MNLPVEMCPLRRRDSILTPRATTVGNMGKCVHLIEISTATGMRERGLHVAVLSPNARRSREKPHPGFFIVKPWTERYRPARCIAASLSARLGPQPERRRRKHPKTSRTIDAWRRKKIEYLLFFVHRPFSLLCYLGKTCCEMLSA